MELNQAGETEWCGISPVAPCGDDGTIRPWALVEVAARNSQTCLFVDSDEKPQSPWPPPSAGSPSSRKAGQTATWRLAPDRDCRLALGHGQHGHADAWCLRGFGAQEAASAQGLGRGPAKYLEAVSRVPWLLRELASSSAHCEVGQVKLEDKCKETAAGSAAADVAPELLVALLDVLRLQAPTCPGTA